MRTSQGTTPMSLLQQYLSNASYHHHMQTILDLCRGSERRCALEIPQPLDDFRCRIGRVGVWFALGHRWTAALALNLNTTRWL